MSKEHDHLPEHDDLPIVILLDADYTAFVMSLLNESKYDWDEDGEVVKTHNFNQLKKNIDKNIAELQAELDAEEVIVCLSDDEVNWRKDVYPAYKSNRSKDGRPELLYPLKAYLADTYRSYLKPTLEGDDVLGILSTSTKIIPDAKKIIVSADKDMKTIPGYLFNPLHPEWGVVHYTEEDADWNWMFQTLMGDQVDGYKGCKGIGQKKAEKILEGCNSLEEMWDATIDTYLDKGMTEDDALANARVARICRNCDYSFKRKEVILWEPPEEWNYVL